MNILAVDDERNTHRLLRGLLTREGHHVVKASSILQAMATVLIGPIDVVLLDLSLSGVEARRLVQFMSSNWNTFHIPVIVISDGKNEEGRHWAKICGCWHYLDKPFDPVELLDAIRRIDLGQRQDPILRS